MSDLSGFLLSSAPGSSAVPRGLSIHRQLLRKVPFNIIGHVVRFADVGLIVVVSVLTGIFFYLAYWGDCGAVEVFFGIGALTAVNFSALLSARGGYRPQNLADVRKQLRDVSLVWIFAFFVLSFVAFSLKVSETYSRGATLSFFAVGWCALVIWRLTLWQIIAKALAEGGFAEQKVILLVEEGQLSDSSVVDELHRYGYKPTRTYQFAPDVFVSSNGSAKLDKLMEEILDASRRENIECVFLLVPWHHRPTIDRLMASLRVLTVPVHLLPDRNVADFVGNRIVNVGGTWIAELKRAPLTTVEQTCKRLFDVSLASFGLLMVAPLLALVAVLIKIESRGPILFMQTRNGFNGRPFRICKFRTMFVVEDGPIIRQATRNDPRVTRLGRMLRRTNIDELPQLLNVIIGDMSLVGPRPHAAAHNSEYEKIIANYAFRYHVKPGLTGWAQVKGFRGETRTLDLMEKRLECDLWYINNWSFWLDYRILLRTLCLGLQSSAY
jgi:Undecaprenyl-phosphate glucose phosphotransferase